MRFFGGIIGARKKAAEGEYRPGPYALGDGWLSAAAGKFMNFWQMGYGVQPYGEANAMVEACVSAYSQTVAMCPGGHWRKQANGGRKLVTNSALSRVLKKPNDYESISDFLLNLTRRLYLSGNAYAYAVRNNRGEIIGLHLMRTGYPLIANDGSVYYNLGGNEIAQYMFPELSLPIPARNVLHVRLHTPRHPLIGESPIVSTTLDRMMAGAALNQQVAFYLNQARPSYILQTEQQLTSEQTKELRELWELQTTGDNAGKTPILTWGLKAEKATISASDGRLADMLKLSDQNIALSYRMPLQVLGLGGAVQASTELLMQSWTSTGLGFTLNHVEEAFGLLFGLSGQPTEYLEFDTKALLRSAFKDRIEGLARGVISGIFAPDEARAEEDLAAVPGGHGAMPRVQQQVVPLSYGSDMKPPVKGNAPKPAPTNDNQSSEQAAKALLVMAKGLPGVRR